jgi:MFS family permease
MHSIPLLFVALALFGMIAALFGPVKYAILPDQLSVSELATGNALVEGATFMAILIGTIAGGLFVAGASHMGWICLAVVGLSILSWAFAARIPVSQPSAPDLPITANPWTSTVRLLKTLYAEPRLWDGMVIVSWFWMVGAIVLSLLPALVKGGVGGTEGVVTVCLAVFAIGIAAGSLFAAQLSHVRPNLALVPIGAIVMGIVGLDLAWAIGSTVHGTDVTAAAFATSFAGIRMLADFFLFAVGRRLVRGAVLRRGPGMVCAVGTGPRDRGRQRACRLPSWWSARCSSRDCRRLVFRSPGSSSALRSQALARSGSCSANGAAKACATSARCCFVRCSASRSVAWRICRRPAPAC